jgi:hypothetical protein
MGRKQQIISLDGGKIRMTVQQIIDHTGLGRAAVNHRLKQSKKSKIVLAPKGKHVIGGYKKAADLEKQKANLKMSDLYKNPEKIEKKKKAEQIKKNHPFYDSGEKGKLHRLLFGKWFKGEK